ncbi:MAG: putative manganese transporter [Prevotellaceae bacterium]|jgi:hypothetical protein|nr:putative manganese transporter [Prevotellaceae bacterium]
MIFDILKNTFFITGLVMVMMLFIEYINVRSRGHSFARLQRSPLGQIVVGALLGIIPGCIGGFAAVSLFTHNMLSFGALVAMTIATTGDEAFLLFAMTPATAITINGILLAIAVAAGWTVSRYVKNFPTPFTAAHFALHDHEQAPAHGGFCRNIAGNLRHLSLRRAMLLCGLLLFAVAMLAGVHDHHHAHGAEPHAHAHGAMLFGERWLNWLFAAVSLVSFVLVASVEEHFLEEHLWKHVIRSHFFKIFLWTLGALAVIAVIHGLFGRNDMHEWLGDNRLLVLLTAILVGLIPESGPHLIFITLYASGSIPFSVLLANCVVQEGHTALPLLAESPRAFVWVKILKAGMGLLIGLGGYCGGF